MSTIAVNTITDASGGSNAVLYGPASPAGSMGFRNRIINGAMTIDQRNAGAAQSGLAAGHVYTVDRWDVYSTSSGSFNSQQNAGSVTPPAGYKNYLGITVASASTPASSDYNFLCQFVEGYNVADLEWGTANAKTVTLSFWVRSSLTGTHSGFISNSNFTTSYPFVFSIATANTWTQVSVTVSGPTSGTWLTTNGRGLTVGFNLGEGSGLQTSSINTWGGTALQGTSTVSIIGTSGATFYITGVQLEVGSVATEFERRPYGTELQLCQRYFQAYQLRPAGGINGFCDSTTEATFGFTLCQQMRSAPTLGSSGTSSNYRIRKSGGTDITLATGPSLATASTSITRIDATVASGLTAGQAVLLEGSGTGSTEYPITFSAEL